MVIVVRYSGATLLRSLMKKTKAAPMAMYPTKKRKKVNVCRPSSAPSDRKAGNPVSLSIAPGTISAAETVDAIARANVATRSRLVVFENFSDIILSMLTKSVVDIYFCVRILRFIVYYYLSERATELRISHSSPLNHHEFPAQLSNRFQRLKSGWHSSQWTICEQQSLLFYPG